MSEQNEKEFKKKELTAELFDKHLKAIKELLKMDDEEFKLVKEFMIDGPIKFMRSPVINPTLFNINIIDKLNTAQLNFVLSLLLEEYSKRKLPEEILKKLRGLEE